MEFDLRGGDGILILGSRNVILITVSIKQFLTGQHLPPTEQQRSLASSNLRYSCHLEPMYTHAIIKENPNLFQIFLNEKP